MRFRVTLDGRLASDTGEDGDPVFSALDAVMAEMCVMGADSPGVEFDADSALISLTANVDAENFDAAVPPVSDMFRLALHAASIGTPSWPASDHPDWKIEFVKVKQQVELVAA